MTKKIKFVTGFHKWFIENISWSWFFLLALKEYKSPLKTIRAMKKLALLKYDVSGGLKSTRMIKTGGVYHWNMHIPGFPGKGINDHLFGELNRISPVHSFAPRLNILFLTITKKCQLSCEHCYARNEMDNKPALPAQPKY